MTRRHFALPALAVSLVAFAVAGNAHAFCQSNSCDPARGEVCSNNETTGCWEGAFPLAWTSSCVTFSVQRDGSPRNGIDAQALESAITTAFKTWMSADCGEARGPSIRVEAIGQVECHQAQYSKDQPNANIYMFHDDEWTGSSAAFAITTTKYDPKTGEIYDADVEINSTRDKITNTEPLDGADLLSIITHESGHFLGLAHSQFTPTTMQEGYTPMSDNLRDLAQDDIDGICSIYPPDRQAVTDDCGPRHGFSSSCHTEEDDSGCDCAVTPGRPTSSAAWLLLGVAGLGALSRRRRRSSP